MRSVLTEAELDRIGRVISTHRLPDGDLVDLLDWAETQSGGHRQLLNHIIANHFLRLILGHEWHSEYCGASENPDPWMMNGSDEWLAENPIYNDVRPQIHASRVIRLSDAIFTLLRSEGIRVEWLRQRMGERSDIQATFVELEVASLISHNGGDVRVIEESGIKGQDFDLLATLNGLDISVEVTTVSHRPLTVQTVLNRLRKKRNQVPDHRPAVLYMHVPAQWMRGDTVAAPVFLASHQFMRSSRRFNAIILVSEEMIPVDSMGRSSMLMRPGYNNFPRHPIPDMTAFLPTPDRTGKSLCADSLLASLRAYRDQRRKPPLMSVTSRFTINAPRIG
jgi:hypothetical protein